ASQVPSFVNKTRQSQTSTEYNGIQHNQFTSETDLQILDNTTEQIIDILNIINLSSVYDFSRYDYSLKLTQMLSGSILILHYLGLIMQDGKIDMKLTTAFTIFGGVRIISGIVSSLLADRVGRRPLLIMSYLGTGCALALTAAYFYVFEVLKMDQDVITPYGQVAFIGIILAVILSTIGFNSLIYVIPAEMFPMNVKSSVAMTTLNVFGGLSNFAIIKLFLELLHLFGLFGVFTMFATISLVGCVFSICLVPETKGKSLREILVALQGTAYDECVCLSVTSARLNHRTDL
ncbi:hypothetical protein evm_014331, partial [Chilo suppressalis]